MHCYLSPEGKTMQTHESDVRNLHAALIERGENASLVQRGVSEAENKNENVTNQTEVPVPVLASKREPIL